MLTGAETQVPVREQKNPTRVVTRPVAPRAAVIKNSGCYTQTPDFLSFDLFIHSKINGQACSQKLRNCTRISRDRKLIFF
ncbi:hypothetical protein ECG_04153 [Echinococcus granulosus]|uniref:Uncharacterized protein n=1 Tax=Echinococcus granulosus TaxID=6210 RepID=A0A068WIX9_ECHGR|nr:hypothetical protein ECG_04153 [Echinococcus granulosus]CDS17569.1 hypothetical protein EgrG_001032700 [Echinococcus granulosus]